VSCRFFIHKTTIIAISRKHKGQEKNVYNFLRLMFGEIFFLLLPAPSMRAALEINARACTQKNTPQSFKFVVTQRRAGENFSLNPANLVGWQ
jgi:hypothetical protein